MVCYQSVAYGVGNVRCYVRSQEINADLKSVLITLVRRNNDGDHNNDNTNKINNSSTNNNNNNGNKSNKNYKNDPVHNKLTKAILKHKTQQTFRTLVKEKRIKHRNECIVYQCINS